MTTTVETPDATLSVDDLPLSLLVIDGEEVPAASGETFPSIDPATGRPVALLAKGGPADIERAVAAARRAFDEGPWPRMRAHERGQVLTLIAAILRERKDELARWETLDVGKPLREAYRDVETVARYFEFYGGVADKISGSTVPLADNQLDVVLKEPIGVSGQILPFNYPLQNTGRGAGPALAVGCTVVLKPSPECGINPLAIARIALECGLPAGCLNVVTGGDDAGAALSAHPDIDQVTFTGSVATGIKVAQAAAANIVPATLELGGKSPAVVFDDADHERALASVAGSVFGNAGQTCAATTRLLLQRGENADAFVAGLVERAQALTIGPGIDDHGVGPIVSARQRDRVVSLLEEAKAQGAVVHTGGGALTEAALADGFFVTPTILEVDANSAMIAQTEVFGPVLVVIRFDTLEEVVKIANDTAYGLNSTIFTRDIDKALSFAKRMRAGQVQINSYGGGTGAEQPFGGYKHSGYGREKGLEGLNSYLQTKNVLIGIKPE